MKPLIIALAFLLACIVFAPVHASAPIVVLRVTSQPQPSATPAPPLPTSVAPAPYPAPPSDAYPAPAHRKHKPAPVVPGLHCGHC